MWHVLNLKLQIIKVCTTNPFLSKNYKYFGAAFGKGKQVAKTKIEKLKLSGMTCRKGSSVEVAKMSEHARSFVKTNNLQGIIEIIKSFVEEIGLPEKST